MWTLLQTIPFKRFLVLTFKKKKVLKTPFMTKQMVEMPNSQYFFIVKCD